jgi:dTDP-4-dehydrorhamnose 3,5-epimerase
VYKKNLIPKKFKLRTFPDNRGLIFEINHPKIKLNFKHKIITISKKNVLRGLHYKKKYENKLLIIIKGKIIDYCISLKKKNFGQKYKFYLKTGDALFVPKGYAHGYLSKDKESIILYKLSSNYEPKLNTGIRWNDPYLNLKWGIKKPILSKNDKKLLFLKK